MEITRFGGPGSDEVYRRWIGNYMMGLKHNPSKRHVVEPPGKVVTIIARNNKCIQAIAWLTAVAARSTVSPCSLCHIHHDQVLYTAINNHVHTS